MNKYGQERMPENANHKRKLQNTKSEIEKFIGQNFELWKLKTGFVGGKR
jgi:hypothetical protein